jgi:hypothetical protein
MGLSFLLKRIDVASFTYFFVIAVDCSLAFPIVFFSIIAMENQRSLYQLSALSFFPFFLFSEDFGSIGKQGFYCGCTQRVVMGEGMMLLE